MWKESLDKNVRSLSELKEYVHFTKEEEIQLENIIRQFPMSVSPYYLSLINWKDKKDPIRKMCIPSFAESDMNGQFDTSGEASNTKVTGIQHKYRETALILSTNQCAMYCRHCFRKRAVGITEEEIAKNFDQVADYVRAHEEITNVLISGGDSFLMEDEQIEQYLKIYSQIDHLDYIRLGTRTPVTFPERILDDPMLLTILKKYNTKKPVYVITHYNHPREITEESARAIALMKDCGIAIRNQTVLLKGVNDSPKTLGTLLRKMTAIGVEPYYIFQCRPVSGVGSHFQVPLKEGYTIVETAKGMQNGIGKSFRYVMSHVTGKIEILGFDGEGEMLFKYHQAKAQENRGKLFRIKLRSGQTWLPEENPTLIFDK